MDWQVRTRWDPFIALLFACWWKLSNELHTRLRDLTYRWMSWITEIHQLRDSRHMRNKFTHRCCFMFVAIHDVGWTVVMLTSNERPAVHLKVRKNCGWQNATEFKKLRCLKLNISPTWMTVSVKTVIRVSHPRRVQARQHSNVLTELDRKVIKN